MPLWGDEYPVIIVVILKGLVDVHYFVRTGGGVLTHFTTLPTTKKQQKHKANEKSGRSADALCVVEGFRQQNTELLQEFDEDSALILMSFKEFLGGHTGVFFFGGVGETGLLPQGLTFKLFFGLVLTKTRKSKLFLLGKLTK